MLEGMTTNTDSFAFVVPEAATTVFSEDAFFTKVIHGVSEELGRAGKQLVLMLAPTRESYERIERFVTGGHVDGVMIASMHGTDSLPAALIDAHVPLVTSGVPLGPQLVPYVDVDHHAAVHDAVVYLQDSGRRHIATIAGPQDMDAGLRRLSGYMAAVEEAGEPPIVAYGNFTRESGVQAMHEIILSGVPFDSVMVASDLMAFGAMFLLRQAGMRVPEDVAVIGFDDIDAARFFDPPLTTIRQPTQDIGVTMAQLVLRLAAGKEVEQVTLLPTELVIRKST